MAQDLQALRDEIDKLDTKILHLLQERYKAVENLAKIKESLELPIANEAIEEKKLVKLTQTAEGLDLNPEFIQNLFEEIFFDARRYQKERRGEET